MMSSGDDMLVGLKLVAEVQHAKVIVRRAVVSAGVTGVVAV